MFSQTLSVKTCFSKYLLRVKLAESTTFSTSGLEFKVGGLGKRIFGSKSFHQIILKSVKYFWQKYYLTQKLFYISEHFSLQYFLVPSIWRNPQFQHGTRVSYDTKWRSLTCQNPKQSCPRGICECDKAMAMCVRDVLESGGQCPEKFGLGDLFGLVKKMKL